MRRSFKNLAETPEHFAGPGLPALLVMRTYQAVKYKPVLLQLSLNNISNIECKSKIYLCVDAVWRLHQADTEL